MSNLKITLTLVALGCGFFKSISGVEANIAVANEERIVGGTPTKYKAFSYTVVIYHKNLFICGGVLIHPRMVVTAAHCIISSTPGNYVAAAGQDYLKDAGVRRQGKQIIMHENYKPNTGDFDICGLQLISPMPSQFTIATLMKTLPPAGTQCVVLGHGLVSENGKISNPLLSAKVKIVALQTCRNKYSGTGNQLTDRMMCAANPGKDACSGDSGGPMVCNNKLAGLVSWGKGCARPKYPGVYASIPRLQGFCDVLIKEFANK